MKRSRYWDEDPELKKVQDNFARAEATLWRAIILGLAWTVVSLIGLGVASTGFAAFTRLFATVFGWGAVGLAAIATALYFYAFLYLRFLGWRG